MTIRTLNKKDKRVYPYSLVHDGYNNGFIAYMPDNYDPQGKEYDAIERESDDMKFCYLTPLPGKENLIRLYIARGRLIDPDFPFYLEGE